MVNPDYWVPRIFLQQFLVQQRCLLDLPIAQV